ncbi:MAG: hypothetical protein WDO73_13080 [Ignavibacteriota bacterium]
MVDAWVRLVSADNRVDLIARLPPGATLKGAAAEMAVVNARMHAADPADEALAEPFASGLRSAFCAQATMVSSRSPRC